MLKPLIKMRLNKIKKEIKILEWKVWGKRNSIRDYHCPSVYVIAKTKQNLEGKKVNIKDIYYVGMTNSIGGLKSRLNQFDNGVNVGYGHSGANRLFKEIMKKVPYKKWTNGHKLFVANIVFHCNVDKKTRTAKDLLIMGKVALKEFEILAMIKNELGREPELNKK